MRLPGVEAIAKRFGEATLTIELQVPDEETLALLVNPEERIKTAQEFVVDSDDNYKLAKKAADSLKDEGDLIESKRKGEGGKGGSGSLNSLKTTWDSLFNPAKKACDKAALIYHQSMRAYEAKKEAEDKKSRQEQETLARKQKEQLLKDAQAQKERAASLTNPRKKEEALRLAESLEIAAASTPDQFAASTTSVPSLGGTGGKPPERWTGTVDENDKEFVYWLWQNDEWRGLILSYMQGGLNDLAKSVKDNKKIPGFTATKASSYRRDPKRKQTAEEK